MIGVKDYEMTMKSGDQIISEHGLKVGGKVQMTIDETALRLCTPYVPMKDGNLIKSGIANTKVGSGYLIWKTPYARKHYYVPAKFRGAPKRGTYWFERMKNEGGKEQITKAAQAALGGKA